MLFILLPRSTVSFHFPSLSKVILSLPSICSLSLISPLSEVKCPFGLVVGPVNVISLSFRFKSHRQEDWRLSNFFSFHNNSSPVFNVWKFGVFWTVESIYFVKIVLCLTLTSPGFNFVFLLFRSKSPFRTNALLLT